MRIEIPENRMRVYAITMIDNGKHGSLKHGACAMEMVSYLAGERWSDKPQCACPVITSFVIAWNDSLDEADRNRLLKPILPRLIGTRSTHEVERRRSEMAIDWLIRTYAPRWLDLVEALRPDAAALRELAPITIESAKTARPIVNAAYKHAKAAWAARAAWAAEAAGAAEAAWAAWAAGAAGAAGVVLRPIVEQCQQDALALLTAMIAEGSS